VRQTRRCLLPSWCRLTATHAGLLAVFWVNLSWPVAILNLRGNWCKFLCGQMPFLMPTRKITHWDLILPHPLACEGRHVGTSLYVGFLMQHCRRTVSYSQVIFSAKFGEREELDFFAPLLGDRVTGVWTSETGSLLYSRAITGVEFATLLIAIKNLVLWATVQPGC